MFPFFEISIFGFWIWIYTFWLTVTICFFLFVWMLKKLSVRFGFDFLIFKKNLLWFFISTFFFSRLFYVIWRWHDLKHIENPLEFFIMDDYNFSLVWAIFWFFLVFFIVSKIRKENLDKFIDGIAISFFFVLTIWFAWALLWWQVYWKATNYTDIWITYTHPHTQVASQVPVFPLPIVYSILFFILFSLLYILSMYVKEKSILWYIWFILFSSIIFTFEFFSWKFDIFKDWIWINLNQIFAIFIVLFCIYRLYWVFTKDSKQEVII